MTSFYFVKTPCIVKLKTILGGQNIASLRDNFKGNLSLRDAILKLDEGSIGGGASKSFTSLLRDIFRILLSHRPELVLVEISK